MDVSSATTLRHPVAARSPNMSNNSSALDRFQIELQHSHRQGSLNAPCLSSFQRILLTTDGTVTDILAAHLAEQIELRKLHESIIEVDRDIEYLDLASISQVMIRKIVLQGKKSKNNYIYAESITVPDRLPPKMQADLIQTQKPIGRLMAEDRLETFREILEYHLEEAAEIGRYFALSERALLISRTYRVMSQAKPMMLITEKFPQDYFRD